MNIQERMAAVKALDLGCTEVTDIAEERNFKAEQGNVLPPFVRVKLVSRPAESSYIRHEIWLPLDWNGIFLGMGNGGLAGNLRYERLAFGERNGCATAHTDMGTSDGRARGAKNPDVHKDFGWRATLLMTDVGKKVTERFYGKPIAHSYFIGRSTGGQQALTLAKRYPKAYECIVAGVPGFDRTHLHTYFLWSYNSMRRADGACLFTKEEIHNITQAAIAYCQEQGVAEKGKQFIPQPPTDKAFLTKFVNSLDFLTQEQKAALLAVYTGPVDPKTGKQIHCGMPLGSENTPTGMLAMLGAESMHFFPFVWAFGADYKGSAFDFSADMEAMDAYLEETLNITDPDLTEFFAAGGKLLMYSGSADACVPFPGALALFKKICQACPQAKENQLRYFILPGMDHAAEFYLHGKAVMNGQFEIANNLDILRLWQEEGIAPENFDVITLSGEEKVVVAVNKVI